MVGTAARSRVSSVTAPSCIGTLRSTRTSDALAGHVADIVESPERGHRRFLDPYAIADGDLASPQHAAADAAAPVRLQRLLQARLLLVHALAGIDLDM